MQQISMAEINPDYSAFVEKFKPKKTTDDCYTPDNVMDAVRDYVAKRYGYAREKQIRPFWPGGDYERENYPDGCAVVDNPPFSILSGIRTYYAVRKIPYFLFAPTLMTFGHLRNDDTVCVLLCGISVTYANGAEVNTSFITNMENGAAVRTCPELYQRIKTEDDKNRKAKSKELPKYTYPPQVMTSAAYTLSKAGIELVVKHSESLFVGGLDSQKRFGKSIYGGGCCCQTEQQRAWMQQDGRPHPWNQPSRIRHPESMSGSCRRRKSDGYWI